MSRDMPFRPRGEGGASSDAILEGNSQLYTPPSTLQVEFFESAHGVHAYSRFGVELTRPSSRDPYSHAIKWHGPDSVGRYPEKGHFDTFGELHRVRIEYIERYHRVMMDLRADGPGTTFGFKRSFVASNGKEYIFTFRYDGERWQEITGFPTGG